MSQDKHESKQEEEERGPTQEEQIILDQLNQLIEDTSISPDAIDSPNYQALDRINCSEIIKDTLYLGSVKSARALKALENFEIYGILNCAGIGTKSQLSKLEYSHKFKKHSFDASDSSDYNIIKQNAQESFDFINTCLDENRKVLVHCVAGANRSATIVVAYLVYKGDTLFDAVRKVISARPWILTNQSFKLQLIRFAKQMDRLGDIGDGNNSNKSKNKSVTDSGIKKQESKESNSGNTSVWQSLCCCTSKN